MAIYIGDNAVKKVYLGATEIKKIYKGITLIYSAIPPPEFDYLAPSDLVASTISTTEIGLTWVNNSVNAEGNSIERREEATAFAEIDTVLPDEEAYLDDTCIEGTKYYYRLRAFKGTEYSDYSNTASATTESEAPAMPTGLTLTLISGGVKIDWTDNSGGTAQTEIWARSNGGTSALLVTKDAGIVTHNDILAPVDLRYYKIRALRDGEYSEFTAEESIAMLSAEKVVNGTFDADTGWTRSAPWTISGGKANYNDTSNNGMSQSFGGVSAGKKYKLLYTISGVTGNAVLAFLGSGLAHIFSQYTAGVSRGNGSYTEVVNCILDNSTFIIYGLTASGSAWSIDNVSVKEILFP